MLLLSDLFPRKHSYILKEISGLLLGMAPIGHNRKTQTHDLG